MTMQDQRDVAGVSQGTVGKLDSIGSLYVLRLCCLSCHGERQGGGGWYGCNGEGELQVVL
jgi:hypothetical protein